MDYNLINRDRKIAIALLSFLDLGEKLDKINNKDEAKEIMVKLNNIYWSDIFNYYEMSELPSVKDIMEEYLNIIKVIKKSKRCKFCSFCWANPTN